ncbi:hypothetical protein [Devosia sp. SD17-2]|uniref:hypothetical protein n=1 Tax=Devosia sp. SD17-2 TaxID=2976459 RepID=UPI0023D8A9C1|nr:hypothetical protein [Devosia sp. SD17-2]WEJ33863.1 hypothetical protein NYQ88_03350 [Devosia sp. SD17-2]
MSFRFTAPDLLNLGPPPGLAGEDFDVLLERARTRLVGELQAGGVVFEVARLDANPVMRVSRHRLCRSAASERE